MDKRADSKKPPPSDRRTGADRRRVEALPPGKRDRRLGLEARKPEVVEIDMSNSEWAALSDLPPPQPPIKK